VETHTHSGRIPANPTDRRRDLRHAASGKVQLRFEGGSPGEVEADLMDISASGFRLRHRHGSLPLGANVAFRHPEAAGKARVVWMDVSRPRGNRFVIIR
jgi:ribosomal protein L35AE/L33A